MMKKLCVGILMLAGVWAQAAEKPNVVFLLSDDQGWMDYGFMGHPHVQTPNLDKIALEGILYDRGYVTAPLCRPSLASLATGLYPHQNGIRGNDPVMPRGWKKRGGGPEHKEMWIKMRNQMTAPMAHHPSFIKELKAHGYATLQTGKWWEGNPLDLGKVHYIAGVTLNGKTFPNQWKPPFVLDVTDALKKGENTLEVSVTSVWKNRLIGDTLLPEKVKRKGYSGVVTEIPEWVTDPSKISADRKSRTFLIYQPYLDCKKMSAEEVAKQLAPSGLAGPVHLEER